MQIELNKRICIIVFYFGKFQNFYPIWLKSSSNNPSIDWLIFTDNDFPFDYAPNTRRIIIKFDEFRKKCQLAIDFPIILSNPYTVCDYRPAFGVIFKEELKGYDFWGHCDCDQIFGQIKDFISDDLLSKYDKISYRGHFSLFRNSIEINNIYKKSLYNVDLHKLIFTNPTNTLFAFEENEINNILENNGYKIFKGLYFADLKTCTNNFEMMHFSDSFQPENKHQIFEYKHGKLIRHFVKDGILMQDEMMYIHFLKRPMNIDKSFNNINHFLIIPNRFIGYQQITIAKVLKWSKKRFYLSYYLERLSWKYFKKRQAGIADRKKFFDIFGHLKREEFKVIIK